MPAAGGLGGHTRSLPCLCRDRTAFGGAAPLCLTPVSSCYSDNGLQEVSGVLQVEDRPPLCLGAHFPTFEFWGVCLRMCRSASKL